MISFEEARRLVLSNVESVAEECVALDRAAGRVLARPVVARGPFPPFSLSAMDGYAVATSSWKGGGPWTAEVVGESRTGSVPTPLVAGTVCRIFTGAALPEGADAVIMQENIARDGNRATFTAAPRAGAHVRFAGEDLKEGELAIEPGTRLAPLHLSLAASLDHPELVVARRPRVVIVCTGDELRAPGEPARPGTIAECNSVGLRALAEQACAEASTLPIVRDDREGARRAFERALADADLLVSVGGVSVGDHDVVRPALEDAGVALDFWKVAIKPGKPLALGRAGRTRVLALPGNPASSLVTFWLFALPLLRAMQGDNRPVPAPFKAKLASNVTRSPGRLEFMRARLATVDGELFVETLANQASGAVTSMAWADALAMIPPEATSLARGERVDVLRLADG
jgi:molybdopterin molybdotransferase